MTPTQEIKIEIKEEKEDEVESSDGSFLETTLIKEEYSVCNEDPSGSCFEDQSEGFGASQGSQLAVKCEVEQPPESSSHQIPKDRTTTRPKCRLCKEIFFRETQLKEHIASVHAKEEIFEIAKRQLEMINKITIPTHSRVQYLRRRKAVMSNYRENLRKYPKLNVTNIIRVTARCTGTPASTIWKMLRDEKAEIK
uniref:C2H2-type domain-containing protein n=1 Tax=Lutzomyia longipalpis TaxID=7200 RepID=A0A1B0GKS7_LUTLO